MIDHVEGDTDQHTQIALLRVDVHDAVIRWPPRNLPRQAHDLSHLRVDFGLSCVLFKIDWLNLTMSLELGKAPPVAPASPSGTFQRLLLVLLGMIPLALAFSA